MCSETSAHKIKPPRNLPKERIQHSVHVERLKSIILQFATTMFTLPPRGEFRPRQTRQLPRVADLKGRLPS